MAPPVRASTAPSVQRQQKTREEAPADPGSADEVKTVSRRQWAAARKDDGKSANWRPRVGARVPPSTPMGETVGAKMSAASRGPATPEVLALARAMLQSKGTTVGDVEAQRLVDSFPGLSRRLTLLAQTVADPEKDKTALQAALRHLMVNVPEAMRGAGGTARSEAKDYARDVGFSDLKFENDRVTAVTPSGREVDLGALPERPSIEDLGRLVNGWRFGTPSVVPPPPSLLLGNGFRIENAHLANHLSSLAYQDPATVKNQLEKWGYDVSTFRWVENRETDTQAFVVNDKNGNTFVSIRGTESLRDGQTDADATLIPAPWAGKNVNVHEGFSDALDSVWDQMEPAIRQARAAAGDRGDVVFTGHSLGGGVGTLAALRATNEGLLPPDSSRTKVYPIASPRVGDEAFADAYNRKLPQTNRLVNFKPGLLVDSQDIVTQVPPRSAGYRHVGNLVRLADDGVRFIPRDDPANRGLMPRDIRTLQDRQDVLDDPRDLTNPGVENLRGDALKEYLKSVALQHLERRDPPSSLPAMSASLHPELQSSLAMSAVGTMPSFKAHLSGEYLRRTGLGVLNQ